jgi:uracil-DNA glycosylase
MDTGSALSGDQKLRELLVALGDAARPGVFNPYTQSDPRFDMPDAASIRLANLAHYLAAHAGARIALIGEAAGYAGCRFTGIPFTCEAQLREWNDPRFRASSLHGDYDERSARCVRRAVGARDDVIFWNVFPWHPHQPRRPLSNRQPLGAELQAGVVVLRLFLSWKQPDHIIAIGRIAERVLRRLNVAAAYVRHPSHGGQPAFRSALDCMLFATGDCQPGTSHAEPRFKP